MKRFFRLSAALAALALLSGCASLLHPRLVEDLQLIQTIGFDGGIGDMTVSVSSGEASEDAVSAQLAARGASIQTAVQRLQDFSPREELFFAHIRYAAVGEDCARGGITPILDYFERGTQTQLSVPLFVVKGESAYTLVAANGGENEITAALSSLEADTKRQGSAHCFTVLEIASRLNFIAYQEHIEIEPDAVNLLARLADGGMRDGVSLLDQCASAAGGAVTLESVYASLGLAGERRTAELMQAIAQQDTAKALTVFSSLYAAGKDVGALLGEMCALCRDLLVLHTAPKSGLAMLSGIATEQQALALQDMFSPGELMRVLTETQKTRASFGKNTDVRVAAELLLMQLCEPALRLDAQALNARISRVEEQLASGVLVKAAPQTSGDEYDDDRPPFPDDADDPARGQLPEMPPAQPAPAAPKEQ